MLIPDRRGVGDTVTAGGNPNFDETTGCFTGPEAYKNDMNPSCWGFRARPVQVHVSVQPVQPVPNWVWWLGGGLILLALAK